MTTILIAKSSDFQENIELNSLLAYLPSSFKVKANRYRFKQDAYNFTLGRLMLKEGLDRIGVPLDSLKNIYFNTYEKPLLDGLSFSISHSQNLVACAFAKEGDIGLDIEVPRELKKEHFRRSFSSDEWAEIDSDQTMDTFYKYWTQKESILKAVGVGLDRLLDIKIEGNKAELSNKKLNIQSLDIEGAYGCLCSNGAIEYSTEVFNLKSPIFEK